MMFGVHLLDLLAPVPGDEFSDERAFRALRRLLNSLGWVADEIERLCGFVRVMPVTFFGAHFDVGVEGAETKLAVVMGVLDEAERLVDAVAWAVDQPDGWVTLGRWPAIGLHRLVAHPASAAAPSLRLYRTPLAWLRAGGEGVVPLDLPTAAREIRAALEAGGRIKAEDDTHAAEIAAAIAGLTDVRGLVVDDREAA